jgi:hypothetical protein
MSDAVGAHDPSARSAGTSSPAVGRQTKKGGLWPPFLSPWVPYCFGQGWTFISGPRSYGGGTWASVVT